MFDIDYEWKLIYLVSFNRMCFLLLAINEVDVLRIWWNYYDCMSDFAFVRKDNFCWKELCWRQQQKEKESTESSKVGFNKSQQTTTTHLYTKRRRRRRRICWCLLWCLLNFLFNYWSITKKYVVEKWVEKAKYWLLNWMNWMDWMDWRIGGFGCWYVVCLIEEWMEFDNKILLMSERMVVK